jgi:hypothetical protein
MSGLMKKVQDLFPGAAVEVSRWDPPVWFRWTITSDSSFTLATLRKLEEAIGHDQINLVPADYEQDYSDLTPGKGFSQGYVSFDSRESE